MKMNLRRIAYWALPAVAVSVIVLRYVLGNQGEAFRSILDDRAATISGAVAALMVLVHTAADAGTPRSAADVGLVLLKGLIPVLLMGLLVASAVHYARA